VNRDLRIAFFISAFAIFVGSAEASPSPATAEDLQGTVAIEKCSGSIVRLTEDEAAPAYLLSAGHCGKPGFAVAPGKAYSLGPGYWTHTAGYPAGATTNRPVKIEVTGLAYATMTWADLALFETGRSADSFRKEGYQVYSLGESLPRAGDSFRVTSAFWKETQVCRVDRILATNADELAIDPMSLHGYEFRNSILFDSDCSIRTGWSGAPIVNESTGQVYGIASRRVMTAPRLPFAGPDPVSQFVGWIFQDKGTGTLIASNLVDLLACVTAEGALRFEGRCELPKIDADAGPRPRLPRAPEAPTGDRRGSQWPKNKAAARPRN
jgi:hypothetical protein